jgi:hypothetical protein
MILTRVLAQQPKVLFMTDTSSEVSVYLLLNLVKHQKI